MYSARHVPTSSTALPVMANAACVEPDDDDLGIPSPLINIAISAAKITASVEASSLTTIYTGSGSSHLPPAIRGVKVHLPREWHSLSEHRSHSPSPHELQDNGSD